MGLLSAIRAGGKAPGAPATEDGERIYAIGDVHGRLDLLDALLGRIAAHERALPSAEPAHIVVLGDMIDRGPDSARVLHRIRSLQQRRANVVALLGNHEDVMLDVLDGAPGALGAWLEFGGTATLSSFGISTKDAQLHPEDTIMRMRQAIPADLVDWLRSLPLSVQSGDYFFCHAGVRPGVAIEQQRREDLLWIRDAFLRSRARHGAVIVHGHSVTAEVEHLPGRIGIDTGAYGSGCLTAVYLEATDREILSVSA